MKINGIQKFDLITGSKPELKEEKNGNKNMAKIGVALSCAVATLLPVLAINRFQGHKLTKDVFQKSSTLQKGKELLKCLKIEYGIKEILAVGLTSILAGTVAGVVTDKETSPKKKVAEGINKASALVVPTILVSSSMAGFNKLKIKKPFNQVLSVLTGVGLGMPVANNISNTINKKIFKDENMEKRKIKLTDYLIHFDDIVSACVLSKVPLHGFDNILSVIYANQAYEIANTK
ncbi:MAG: hypothetical protein E7Z91_03435 [Cyanobacteria bacterium SIG30]|nr:hypothetical protein [Cyanobacteria bacterium SIG30]